MSLSPAERAVKTAVRMIVDGLGGLDAAACVAGRKRSVLAEYGSLDCADRFPPADVILRLEASYGKPLISAALARAAGQDLVHEAPAIAGEAIGPLQAVARDAAEVMAETIGALQDGRIGPTDRGRLVVSLATLSHDADAARAVLRGSGE